ncbi:MAG: hypothetical protein U0797_27145 [Gemmataceae bacterium]
MPSGEIANRARREWGARSPPTRRPSSSQRRTTPSSQAVKKLLPSPANTASVTRPRVAGGLAHLRAAGHLSDDHAGRLADQDAAGVPAEREEADLVPLLPVGALLPGRSGRLPDDAVAAAGQQGAVGREDRAAGAGRASGTTCSRR